MEGGGGGGEMGSFVGCEKILTRELTQKLTLVMAKMDLKDGVVVMEGTMQNGNAVFHIHTHTSESIHIWDRALKLDTFQFA